MEFELWAVVFRNRNADIGIALDLSKELVRQARVAGYPLYLFEGQVYRVPPEGEHPWSQPIPIQLAQTANNNVEKFVVYYGKPKRSP